MVLTLTRQELNYSGETRLTTTGTTRMPAFWGFSPPPHSYPYYWAVHIGSEVHTIEQFILDPKPILLSSSYLIPSPYYWAVHIGSQTHTIEQFILDPKSILLSSSYWIPNPYYWAVHIGSKAHTIEQFILDPKPILLSSSYWIPSQNKTKWKLQV